MILQHIKQRLRDNWGEKADAMDCYCEVKYTGNTGTCDCYIYAMNPDNEDEIMCIIDFLVVEVCKWSMKELEHHYDLDGEYLYPDAEFRRIKASTLLSKLEGRT